MCLYFLLFLSFVHWPLLRLDVSFIIWYHFIIYYSFYSILFCFISFYSILFIFLFHLKFHFVSFNFILLYIISFYFRGKIWKSGTPSPLIILRPPPFGLFPLFWDILFVNSFPNLEKTECDTAQSRSLKYFIQSGHLCQYSWSFPNCYMPTTADYNVGTHANLLIPELCYVCTQILYTGPRLYITHVLYCIVVQKFLSDRSEHRIHPGDTTHTPHRNF